MAAEVKRPYRPKQVALVGVDAMLPHERETLDRLGIRRIASAGMRDGGNAVGAWIRERGFERVAVHLGLDVLDPANFRSLLFCNPDVKEPIEVERGKAGIRDVGRVLREIVGRANVVA